MYRERVEPEAAPSAGATAVHRLMGSWGGQQHELQYPRSEPEREEDDTYQLSFDDFLL
ncbi:MAG: hypothetical protein SVW02_03235 [Candidatus Nanohaloarchaea archaeon]|nr:hypothetical protein [Candidatus Nanohaloarchaea archaeon]